MDGVANEVRLNPPQGLKRDPRRRTGVHFHNPCCRCNMGAAAAQLAARTSPLADLEGAETRRRLRREGEVSQWLT